MKTRGIHQKNWCDNLGDTFCLEFDLNLELCEKYFRDIYLTENYSFLVSFYYSNLKIFIFFLFRCLTLL